MKDELTFDIPVRKPHAWYANGAFMALRDGRIMFAYNDSILIRNHKITSSISYITSPNHGFSWSRPEKMEISYPAQETGCFLNPSLVRLLDGNLAIFFTICNTALDVRLYMCSSADEGLTWSEPRPCIPYDGFFMTNNDRVIRLSSGRLISCSAYHSNSEIMTDSEELPAIMEEDVRNINLNAITHFFFSDDDGLSWRMSLNAVSMNIPASKSGLQEPGITELNPGVIWGYARTDLGRQYEFFSMDNGLTWTSTEPSRFAGACTPMLMKRIPRNKWLIVVYNPIPSYLSQEMDMPQSGRFCLAYSISQDNGITWQEPVALENDVNYEFSYPAVYFTEQYVLISYDADTISKKHKSYVRIRAIPYGTLI